MSINIPSPCVNHLSCFGERVRANRGIGGTGKDFLEPRIRLNQDFFEPGITRPSFLE